MYKKLNYAIGYVASTTAIGATTLTLKAGHTITTDTGGANKFVAVLHSGTKSSPYQDTTREIVEAYRTDTNDFVIARAKENTIAKEWVENDKFMLIASAGVFDEYETAVDAKAPLTAPTFATSITGSYLTASEMLITDANKKIISAPVATYPSLTELSYVKGLSSAIQSQLNAKGVGDMLLSGVQSVTGLKTFNKDKIAMKGTSTGVNTISVANTSATSYTNTLPAKNGTFAMTDDIVSQVEDNITDGHTTVAPSGNAVFDALALKANLISPSFTTPTLGAATGTSLALEGTTLEMLSLKNTDANSYTRMLFDGTGVDFTQGVGNASAAITDLRNKFYIYDFTNSKTAFTIVPNTLAAKLYGTLETVGGATVGGTLAIGTNNLTMTGSLAATGARVTKGWFTNLEVTNLPTVNGGTLASALSLGTMASETATNYVAKSLFDANTILYATSDNTPAALTVAEQRVVGRLTGGAIDDIAIGIADNNILQVDDASVADNDYAKFTANGIEGVPYSTVLSDIGAMTNPMTTAGDVIYGGVDGLPTRLAKGDDGKVLTLVSGMPSWEDAGTANALPLSGGTMTGGITLATGTTTVFPFKMVAGTNLTTPVAGVFEFDGTNLYFSV